MSKLTEQQIHKIARLARLELKEAEIPNYCQELSSILDFVEQINSIDTSGITPMAHPQDNKQRLRSDEVTETNERELLQQNAPATTAGLYLVPQVIEEAEDA